MEDEYSSGTRRPSPSPVAKIPSKSSDTQDIDSGFAVLFIFIALGGLTICIISYLRGRRRRRENEMRNLQGIELEDFNRSFAVEDREQWEEERIVRL
jgi:hypothetical protein